MIGTNRYQNPLRIPERRIAIPILFEYPGLYIISFPNPVGLDLLLRTQDHLLCLIPAAGNLIDPYLIRIARLFSPVPRNYARAHCVNYLINAWAILNLIAKCYKTPLNTHVSTSAHRSKTLTASKWMHSLGD